MKITIIQMNSDNDKSENLKQTEDIIDTAVRTDRSDLVCLPEVFACIASDPARLQASAESFDKSTTLEQLAKIAREHNIFLHAGSLIEIEGGSFYNTSVVFNGKGEMIAKYRKIHRFDITLPDGTEVRESNTVERGNEIVTYAVGELKVGCTICYDIRFPELYRALRDQDVNVIMVPSAFSFPTGSDHWEVLLRARAIETQCYIVAPGQVLSIENGKYTTWGHSMIVDPWGQIIAQVSNKIGWATTTVDLDWLEVVRARIPVHEHHVL